VHLGCDRKRYAARVAKRSFSNDSTTTASRSVRFSPAWNSSESTDRVVGLLSAASAMPPTEEPWSDHYGPIPRSRCSSRIGSNPVPQFSACSLGTGRHDRIWGTVDQTCESAEQGKDQLGKTRTNAGVGLLGRGERELTGPFTLWLLRSPTAVPPSAGPYPDHSCQCTTLRSTGRKGSSPRPRTPTSPRESARCDCTAGSVGCAFGMRRNRRTTRGPQWLISRRPIRLALGLDVAPDAPCFVGDRQAGSARKAHADVHAMHSSSKVKRTSAANGARGNDDAGVW
jgi:hypothetical protein